MIRESKKTASKLTMSNHYGIDFKYLRSCVNWKLTLKAINISRCFTPVSQRMTF
jgi:hypothetical protein